MTDDEINTLIDSITLLSEEYQVMSVQALLESLPLERQEVICELMRAILESG